MKLTASIHSNSTFQPELLQRKALQASLHGQGRARARMAIPNVYIARTHGVGTLQPGPLLVKKALSAAIHGQSTLLPPAPKERRNLNNPPATEGVQAYALFFPPWKFLYQDEEPGSFTTSAEEIKGLVTGVKQLGSMLMPAFVNEPVDIRWFGATDPVNDWGDGYHEMPGSFVHTYTEPGLYWIQAAAETKLFRPVPIETVSGTIDYGTESTIDSANAARLIKVVRRDYRGNGGTLDSSGMIWSHDAPYAITISENTEGNVDGAFAMQFALTAIGNYPDDNGVGQLPARSGVLVFIESFEDGQKLPGLQIVAGGFTANRSLVLDPTTGYLTGIAFDPLYWLNLQQMREQYYENLGMLASTVLGQTATQILHDVIDECGNHKTTPETIPGSPGYTIDVPALDLALLGYVPEHYLPTLRPDIAAAHIIQHVRITVPDLPAPLMLNHPKPTSFGNLGQFSNIRVSPDFDEKVALGGFHSFNVGAGPVLSNIRQMLENQGATFHSRSDLTFVMDYKPFYKDELPSPVFDIEVPKALAPAIITEGTPQPLFRVQIQKPILGLSFDNIQLPSSTNETLNPATGQPATLSDVGLIIASKAYKWGLMGVSAATWSDWYKAVAMPLWQAANSPQTVDLSNWDYYNDSLDQRNFIWEVQVGEPGGMIIGPIQNVFTDDLTKFAIGVAREKVAHWQLQLALPNTPEINLGDLVYITCDYPALQINWDQKVFWVRDLQMSLAGHIHTRQVTLIEVRPEDVVVTEGPGAQPPPEITITAPSATQVALSWITPTGLDFDYYRIGRSLDASGPYERVVDLHETSYGDNGLTAATKYYYMVSAIKNDMPVKFFNPAPASVTTPAA